jgi:hypothetical protein
MSGTSPSCGDDGHVLCAECFQAHTERALSTDPIAYGDRWRKALEEIREIAAREWAADETSYEWYGDIAGIAEMALGLPIGGR